MKVRGVFPVGIVLMLLLGVSSSFAQQYEDVVYLKNGGVRRGLILEQIPGELVKLKTKYGEIFVISMSDISKIVKEEEEVPIAEPAAKSDNAPRAVSDVKLESWYTYWGLGFANMSYTDELDDFFVGFERECTQCDNFSLSLDLLGFYWPLKNQQTIVGGVYNASGDRYTNKENKDFWMQATSGQFSISAMHFPKVIGEGPFLRADLGWGFFGVEVYADGEALEPLSDWEKSGLAGLFGVGYAVPVGGGGTRILFNANYAIRPGMEIAERGYNRESGSVRTFSFTLGALL
jgi:hypothetical protein